MALRHDEQLIDYENIELEDVNGFYAAETFKHTDDHEQRYVSTLTSY